jgi:membrane-bound lytic murein transglycosylase B
MNLKLREHWIRRCFTACVFWALGVIACQGSAWGKEVVDYFGPLEARLVADGFDAEQIRQLYARPEVTFETQGLSLFFRHREATLDYGQFSTPDSIRKSREYLAQNQPAFSRAENTYGVDREIITAILLVESRLGAVRGRRSVLNVLSSMAALVEADVQEMLWAQIADFSTLSRADYDKWVQRRSGWAYRELTAFITYAGREQIDPAAVNGSYAGALGYAQFMPTSILAYARDGNADGKIDLFDHPDAIASIANYLNASGWRPGIDREKAFKVIFQYNRSGYYVNTILKVADLLKG